MPRPSSTRVNVSAVNCAPWSVLNISACGKPDRASWSAATQKPVSSVFDSRQASTRRVYQSMMAIR